MEGTVRQLGNRLSKAARLRGDCITEGSRLAKRIATSGMVAALASSALITVLVVLIAAPLAHLALSSVSAPDGTGLTVGNYITAFGRARHLQAIINTLILGVAVTALCLIMAVPMAWAVARTDMPWKNFIRFTVIATFITPSYLGGVAWILLGSPRAGLLNKLWMAATGAQSELINIYSFAGLVFVVAAYAYPYVFVSTSSALDLVSTELEEAASILGSSRARTALKVTLPLVAPAVLAGSIIVFLDTIALFGTPALIAIPAHINVMTTQLWNFFEYPVQVEVAAAYCMPLIAITMGLLWLQRVALGRKGFVTLTGKGGSRRMLRLGNWRWVMLSYSLVVGALSVYLPFLVIIQAACAKAWGRGFSLSNLTLENFRYLLFDFAITRSSIEHTLVYSGVAATLSVLLAFIVAYVINRRLVGLGRLLESLVMLPFVIPGIVLGMAFYATFAPWPFALNGTAAIVILAFIVRFIPIAYMSSSAALMTVNPEMEHAARIIGAGWTRTMRRILVPLLKTSLAGGWLLIFIPAARELSTALFVIGPQTRVLSILMLDLNEQGSFENLAAAGCILLLVMLTSLIFGMRLLGRDFMLR
jgi:iron(III) transport system permease protein